MQFFVIYIKQEGMNSYMDFVTNRNFNFGSSEESGIDEMARDEAGSSTTGLKKNAARSAGTTIENPEAWVTFACTVTKFL